jgi:hypothetical protein
MKYQGGLASLEWVSRELVELTEFVVETIVGEHRASEFADKLVKRNEGASAIDRH